MENDEKNQRIIEEENRKIAQALNLCTVSLSQIIDYKDAYILEQEYDVILNNLNLEKMPKDEELLSVLSQILDSIIFFRIQEEEKEEIEKEYQEKMKSAIWSAIPNISVFFSDGSLFGKFFSIITNLGTAYFNYRKEKSEINREKANKERNLHVTAIERFNSLRRELFTASWNLCAKHGFSDKYRLTEKQIKQYNDILMDSDMYRRYKRLEVIKEDFEAYPEFWYWLGNAANYLSADNMFKGDDIDYAQTAEKYYENFFNLNGNLLRIDYLYSTCALEYVELMVRKKEYDQGVAKKYIQEAWDKSGGREDILELCAFAFLKIGEIADAEYLFERLVYERYNTVMNAQLLSCLYVKQYIETKKGEEIKKKYDRLVQYVNKQYLMPIHEKTKTDEACKEFMCNQKWILLKKYTNGLNQFSERYLIQFNKCLPMPYNVELQDEDYLDTDESRLKRITAIEKGIRKKTLQVDEVCSVEVFFAYIDTLEKMYYASAIFVDDEKTAKEKFMTYFREKNADIQVFYNGLKDHIYVGKKGEIETFFENYSFRKFVKAYFDYLAETISKSVFKLDTMEALIEEEIKIKEFCSSQNIIEREIVINLNDNYEPIIVSNVPFIFNEINIIGEDEPSEYQKLRDSYMNNIENKGYKKKMKQILKDCSEELFDVGKEGKMGPELITGENEINKYVANLNPVKDEHIENKIIAVIKSSEKKCDDILFCTDGMGYSHNKEIKDLVCPYDEVFSKDKLIRLKNSKHTHKLKNDKQIKLEILEKVIKNLSEASKAMNVKSQNISYEAKSCTFRLLSEQPQKLEYSKTNGIIFE